jgi:hypothetical protein
MKGLSLKGAHLSSTRLRLGTLWCA